MDYKKYLSRKNIRLKIAICIIIFLSFFITGCHPQTSDTKPVYLKTRNNKPVVDEEILSVDLTNDESELSAIYLLSEENKFGSTFISKYDIGTHSKAYKVKLKVEYLDNTQMIDYMEMPSSSTVTNLYITMDNYDFIVALFDETKLISKGVFNISTLNQEDKDFLCKASTSDKLQATGSSEMLSNNLIVYNTKIYVVHGDEEWNEDNEEYITLSVILEEN